MNSLLIIAPGTARAFIDHGTESKFSATYIVDRFIPESILQKLTDYHNEGIVRALIVDKCLAGMLAEWAWVGDAINRSGTNPLRGLSGDWPDPFLDLSRLYRIPPGAASITVTALGGRAVIPEPPGPSSAYLHALAMLAHRSKIAVSGILVSADTKADLAPDINSVWEWFETDENSSRNS